MTKTHDSPLAGRRVLVLGDDDRAAGLVSSLESDGIDAAQAESVPEALATLESVSVALLVVVDGVASHPTDVFGAAARRGKQLPGVFVGSRARKLPPGVEQAPASVDAAASAVRQQLLAAVVDEAEPVVERDALTAYGQTISHELRNHLSVARLAIGSLDGPTVDQALEALDRLEGVAREAEAVANGEVSETASVSLVAAAEDAIDRVQADDATIHVDASMEVSADRKLLTLLIENLVRNSVEHGSAGDDSATVGVLDTESGFAVVDNGPGLDGEDAFAWGYSTGDGKGVGLAIVQEIALAHGWEIDAVSDDGARIEIHTD